jgi:hypothetical protein
MYARFPLLLAILVLGCSRDPEPQAKQHPADPAIASIFSKAIPEREAASGVAAARAAAENGDHVVVKGRVRDFITGLAAFELVDAGLPACGEKEGVPDSCRTPWDYCCEAPDVLAKNVILVELRKDGAPLRNSLADGYGLVRLAPVTVAGTVERDAHGNVTLLATAVTR